MGVLLTVRNLILKKQTCYVYKKTYAIKINYKLCDKCKTHTNTVKNLRVLLDSKSFLPSPFELRVFSVLKIWDSYVSLTYSCSTIDYYCYSLS
jgi:acetyl-CoA carboxylase beta subunit